MKRYTKAVWRSYRPKLGTFLLLFLISGAISCASFMVSGMLKDESIVIIGPEEGVMDMNTPAYMCFVPMLVTLIPIISAIVHWVKLKNISSRFTVPTLSESVEDCADSVSERFFFFDDCFVSLKEPECISYDEIVKIVFTEKAIPGDEPERRMYKESLSIKTSDGRSHNFFDLDTKLIRDNSEQNRALIVDMIKRRLPDVPVEGQRAE